MSDDIDNAQTNELPADTAPTNDIVQNSTPSAVLKPAIEPRQAMPDPKFIAHPQSANTSSTVVYVRNTTFNASTMRAENNLEVVVQAQSVAKVHKKFLWQYNEREIRVMNSYEIAQYLKKMR